MVENGTRDVDDDDNTAHKTTNKKIYKFLFNSIQTCTNKKSCAHTQESTLELYVCVCV